MSPLDGIEPTDGRAYAVEVNAYEALRANLKALMAAAKEHPKLNIGPVDVLTLEAEHGVSKTTLYRLMDPSEEQGRPNLRLDTLTKIAAAYRIEVWQLLIPPHTRREISRHKKAYKLLKRAAEEDDQESMGDSPVADRLDPSR